MAMYEIVKNTDGTFACIGRLQDGTERWTEKTLAGAVKSMVQFARVMNGTKLTRKGIAFYRQRVVRQSVYEPWDGKS